MNKSNFRLLISSVLLVLVTLAGLGMMRRGGAA
jgi:hypothetical protein